MFQALPAHLYEVLYQRYLVYCVRVMSVGYARNIPSADGAALLEDE
jgi:hypothetical protein